MIILRALTVWVAAWFTVAILVIAIHACVYGNEPFGSTGNWFLTMTMIVQPALCACAWATVPSVVERLRTPGRPQPIHYLRDEIHQLSEWVRYG